MDGPPTNEILVSVLLVMRQQVVYMHCQHGWLIAVADTLRSLSDETAKVLESNAFYDQGPRQDEQITQNLLALIDELIQRLRDPVQ